MNNWINRVITSNKLCFRFFGLNFEGIKYIANEVEILFESERSKVGRNKKLSYLNMVLLFLLYLRKYYTMESLGILFGISTSSAWRYVKSMTCVFENLKCLNNIKINDNCSIVLVDGTETKVEKPKYNSESYYGRKKMYSIKSEIVVNAKTMEICYVECCEGSVHDFELFKYSYDNISIDKDLLIVCDAGYCGIQRIHANSLCILKKSPGKELNVNERLFNKAISKFRVRNEHVIGKLKFWKILNGTFRKCKCLLWEFERILKIVSSIYNLGLNLN